MVCNNVSTLHRFGDNNTFAVSLTGCGLENFFTFDTTSNVRFLI